jgi:hypothetical protein
LRGLKPRAEEIGGNVRKYGYDKSPLLAVRFFQVSGVVSIVLGTAFSCELLFAGFLMGPSRWGIGCFSIWAFAIAWLIGSFFINMYPAIWLEEANLIIPVFFLLARENKMDGNTER